MEGASGGVGVHALAQEALVLHLLADESSRDGDLLSAGDHLHSNTCIVSFQAHALIVPEVQD